MHFVSQSLHDSVHSLAKTQTYLLDIQASGKKNGGKALLNKFAINISMQGGFHINEWVDGCFGHGRFGI